MIISKIYFQTKKWQIPARKNVSSSSSMTSNKFQLNVIYYFTLDNKRTCTDVFCLIVGLLFSIIMIILALVLFNYGKNSHYSANYFQANFPADSDGVLCGKDKNNYPYIYFANPPEIVIAIYKLGKKSVCGIMPESWR